MIRVVVWALGAAALTGCALEGPGSYAVDPACPADVAATMADVEDTYCQELGLCMGLRPYPAADVNVNCTWEYGRFGRDDGSAAHASPHVDGLNPAWRIVVDMSDDAVLWELTPAWLMRRELWRVLAHELAHTHGVSHGGQPGQLMSARQRAGDGLAELDSSVTCPLIGEGCP